MPLAYSYLRFSSPEQAKGDSLRRQTAARDHWLSAHPDVKLDTALVMTDAGRSGFSRKDWPTYALAQFVEHIKAGRVGKGSYLLVENLDRLSRESAGEATELFLSIVNAGVVVVQLSPVVMEFRKPVNLHSLMFAIMELSRGHSESAVKSDRMSASWARKQKEAPSKVVTKVLPGWIVYAAGKLTLDPVKADAVRRVFALSLAGHGAAGIAQKLNAEGVPVIGRKVFKGRAVKWANTTVYYILTTRAVIGEYVPYRATGRNRKEGEPVPGYFPPVIDPDTFFAVQGALKSRALNGRGRKGKHVNVFSGLLKDSREGGSMGYRHWKTFANITPIDAERGRSVKSVSFPAAAFDGAVLSKLSEVTAKDIEGDDDAGRKAEALAGRLAELDSLAKAWEAKMDDPAIIDTVAKKLADLNTRRKAVAAELDAAKQEAASPVARAWGEFRTLADLLDAGASDELRVKVRAALRRAVETVTCLFVARGPTRVAAVRVQFRGRDVHRDYFIVSRPAAVNQSVKRPATWEVASFSDAGLPPLDLREQGHAARLEKAIATALAKASAGN